QRRGEQDAEHGRGMAVALSPQLVARDGLHVQAHEILWVAVPGKPVARALLIMCRGKPAVILRAALQRLKRRRRGARGLSCSKMAASYRKCTAAAFAIQRTL